jgi:hypothetical protein
MGEGSPGHFTIAWFHSCLSKSFERALFALDATFWIRLRLSRFGGLLACIAKMHGEFSAKLPVIASRRCQRMNWD